jgi:[protein-PII] uridylyltransferase
MNNETEMTEFPLPAELGVTKNGIKEIKSRMAQGTLTSPSPRELLRQYSEMVDGLVRKAFQKAQSTLPSPSVCLVAVGGYGRGELAPYSDVDLLLLHAPSNLKSLSPLTEKILYPLWDLGLEVSCSARSIAECLRMAQSDLQIKTSLIEGRYLDGEYEFFRRFYGLFSRKVLHRKVRNFAEALARDLHLRRRKYEDPVYVLEPNLKEGEGGLRDFQIGRWVIRAKYQTDRWESILFPDHSRMLDKSLQFLWTLRNQLHLMSGRRQDNLTFEWQERIASVLGFSRGPGGIEEMMREYHLSTQRISNFVNDILERALYEPPWFRKVFLLFQGRKIGQNFKLAYGELSLLDPTTFKRDPTQLMALFQHCQTYQAKMDFRVEEALMEALPFIDDRFRQSAAVNQTFLSLLKRGNGVKVVLKKMHELGFLSHYIPEFAEIEGKVHYDLYHVHPVDLHSLLAVEELEKLRDGHYQEDLSLLTSLIREIEKPEILFLTTLLHDIGKGREGDHSITGAEILKSIGERMGLSSEDRDIITFLVRYHLSMLQIAFRRDLHDEQVIFRFANDVKELNRLKMLYLLTFADIKAVGPEAWTPWKNTLLMELFLKTSHFFAREALTGPFSKGEEMIKKLKESLSPELFTEYAGHLPDRYLSCYSSEEISRHIEMARAMEKEPLLVEWEIEKGMRATVTVCTKDRYGLFSRIAGSMFLNRLNILEAQIHTWGNGVALDMFRVEDVTKEIERRLQEFRKDLGDILNGTASLKTLFAQRKETNGTPQKVIPRVPADVKVDNQDSDFYTIVEVTGEDRLGILYEMTQALTDHGCNIHFARISTLGNRIVDVFYIQDTWGEKIEERQKVDQLRQILQQQLTSIKKITL